MKSEPGGMMPGEAVWQHPCLQRGGAGDHKPGFKANPRACTTLEKGESDAELVQRATQGFARHPHRAAGAGIIVALPGKRSRKKCPCGARNPNNLSVFRLL